jgi:hypothetical protein
MTHQEHKQKKDSWTDKEPHRWSLRSKALGNADYTELAPENDNRLRFVAP